MSTLRLTAAIALVAASASAAEIRLPQASPAATVALTVGVTDIAITYHRPGVKGRQIWGVLVPFDQVWRLGANEATTISFSDPVKVAGKDVPAGTYALFAIPGRERWTIILNTQAQQWGAYFRKPDEDVLHFEVTPEQTVPCEWMRFTLEPQGNDKAVVAMHWEELRVAFPISVDVSRVVWASLDAALAKAGPADLDPYFQAAKYSLDSGERADRALGWAERALAIKPMFWTFELEARLLHRAGRTAEALPLVAKAIADAKGKAPQEYIAGLEKARDEWTKTAAKH